MCMTESRAEYAPGVMVDGQARCPLPPQPPPRRRGTAQWLLFLLVSLALCGMAVEACFIYHLYTIKTQNWKTEMSYQDRNESEAPHTTSKTPVVKPSKPAAHLTAGLLLFRGDGVLLWNPYGDSFIHEMQYRDGQLVMEKQGYYFIYSKVFFTEPVCSTFTHKVMCRTPQNLGRDTELMQSRRFHCRRQEQRKNLQNSYLGGVFLLGKGDSIYVKANNHTQIVLHTSSENFFGVYII